MRLIKLTIFLFLLILTSFVLAGSKSDDGASSPDAELTDEQIEQVEQMFDAVTSIEEECNRLIELDLTDEELKESITEYISSLDNVESVEREGSYHLRITYDSGLESYVMIGNPWENEGVDYGNSNIASGSILSSNTSTIQTRSSEDSDNFITNNKVLIWAPFEEQLDSIERIVPTLKPVFDHPSNNLKLENFIIDIITNTNCSVNSLSNLTDYGIVILNTHGAEGDRIYTREGKNYSNSGKIATGECGFVIIIANNKVENICYITSKYISNLDGVFNNSIIFNGSCQSTKIDNFWNAFKSKGAGAYLGFSENVDAGFCQEKYIEFFTNLVINLNTVGESHSIIQDKSYIDMYNDYATVAFEIRGEQPNLQFEKIEEEPESSADGYLTVSLSGEDRGGLESLLVAEPNCESGYGGYNGYISEYINTSQYGGKLVVDNDTKIAIFNWSSQLPVGVFGVNFAVSSGGVNKSIKIEIKTRNDNEVYTYQPKWSGNNVFYFIIASDGKIIIDN